MRYGLALPTSGEFASADSIGTVAAGAERIGLDTVWVFERLLSPTGLVSVGGQEFPMPDNYNLVYSPLESLAFAAAKTSKIRLGTSIIIALFHNPVALARSLATVDRLSNGRIVAGLGQGWMPQEFTAAGVSTSRKGAGFAEFVEALRAVWSPDPVTFAGRFYTIPESNLGPKPVRQDGIPLLVGAVAPPSIERAAALGMGLNPILMSWDDLGAAISTFREAEQKAGREPGSLPIVVRVNNSLTDEPLDERGLLGGSVEQVAEELPRLEELGVDEVFWSMDYVPTPPEAQIARMERLLAATS